MEIQEYKGQILGTNDLNEVQKIKVDNNGYLKTTGDYFDNISGAASNITIEHVEIHKGNVFHVEIHKGNVFSVLYKNSILASSSVYIQIKTGTKSMHLKPTNFSTDGDKFTISFFEEPVLQDGVTPVTIINRNRNSVNTPLTVFYSDPTVTSDGTKIDEFYLGGSYGQKITGSDIISGVDEFILKPNTNYLYKITNEGVSDAIIMTKLFFYEK